MKFLASTLAKFGQNPLVSIFGGYTKLNWPYYVLNYWPVGIIKKLLVIYTTTKGQK